MTSAPRVLAASMAAPAVVPQSTVMMSLAPSSTSPAIAPGVGPKPPVRRARNKGGGGLSSAPRETLDERHRRCAIDVVVAENGNGLRDADRSGETLRRSLHVLKARRVRQEMAKRRVEIMGKRDGVRAARGKQSTDKFGKAVCL